MDFETGERATEFRREVRDLDPGGPETLMEIMAETAKVVFGGCHQLPGAAGLCQHTTPSWRMRYSQPLRLPVGLSAAELDPAVW